MKKLKLFKDFLYEFKLSNNPIDDITGYINKMKKGIGDKLFFLNKIKIDTLVDFGCADGSLLKKINKMNLNINLIGYDIDREMINFSKVENNNINFYSDWNEVIENIKGEDVALLLSSVIHEIYSYGTSVEIRNFWSQVFNNNFKYVIIRDMVPSTSFGEINMDDIKKVREKSDPKYLNEFENVWGDISSSFRVLLHWLLKYKYVDNWSRELRENYLPISLETLKKKIPNNWNIIYERHYTYEYIRDLVKQDYDIDLNEKTHLQMIIKNNNI